MRIRQLFVIASLALLSISATADEVMTKEDGTYVVNTGTLAADVNGYMEATPLKIFIRDDKIQRIEALPNRETQKYFHRVKTEMLTKWDGKKVKSVLREMKAETDAVTGATYSSNAVLDNVKRGLLYYLKHKK